ncbi:toxin-antitoxin system HicB family antitoxin [Novosphingobium ginsenosidimutans]|uniref:Toxin-antitoxin system HicB family antitoxin n=1 Tax=Novosphingobium ginsenosidimutans TaxID=1176536 RepID=A0A5B8S202_9SPHN|nr:toxin-antitoxin system HicB family antitoxin [Novosphingobium ginsenosidimutans]QEA15471.1 toxin-antitoxin system HicB family antitoxin [Novosphingobium ginsenosidimutans]
MAPPAKKAFPLRLDPALFTALERAAASDFRSVNAEIEVLLREALGRRGIKVAPSEAPRRGRPPKEKSDE